MKKVNFLQYDQKNDRMYTDLEKNVVAAVWMVFQDEIATVWGKISWHEYGRVTRDQEKVAFYALMIDIIIAGTFVFTKNVTHYSLEK